MNFLTRQIKDILIIELHGQGEYSDEIKLQKQIKNISLDDIRIIAVDFSHVDTINSSSIATLLSLIKYIDEYQIEIVYIGANDKIIVVLERAFTKEYIKFYTIEEFNYKYNINL